MKTEFFNNKIIGSGYTVTELSNGLKVFIYEKPNFNSVYAAFGTKYGSVDSSFTVNGEKVTVPDGIAHFLEHKLFESEDGDAFSKYAATGAYANAFTSFDRTCYIFSCTERFEENLDILLNFVQSPYFTEETVKKEQGIIGQEIRMYDDSPNWNVLFRMLESMYFNNPVKIDIAGTTESIAKIDADVLFKCYNTFYNPSNMFICIAGNVNTKKVLAKIEASIKPAPEIDLKRGEFNEPDGVISNYTEKALEVALPLFCFGFKQNINNSSPTFEDTIFINALLRVISNDASPLYKRLNDMKLINDEFDAEYFSGRGFSALIFEGESVNPKAVADEILLEIESVKKNGLDNELFEAVKREMYGQAIKRFNSVEATALMLIESAVLGYDYSKEMEIIKTMTVDDLMKQLYIFDREKSVLSVINKRV